MPKVIVIGLDGAGFDLLGPWIETGLLPNLARLKREGMWGHLRSCLPPVTSPNWKCYSTGRNPGKLGVFWWEVVDVKQRTIVTPNSRFYRDLELWDYLSQAGLRCAVINMPTTFPPKPVNGVMISGGVEGSDKYTYPPELSALLKRQFDYSVYTPRTTLGLRHGGDGWKDVREIIAKRFQVMEYLEQQQTFDFVHLTLFYTNALNRFLWNAEPTLVIWQDIDAQIGKLLNTGTDVILMSDHGSAKLRTVFYVNTWLQTQGYLRLKTNAITKAYKMGLSKERLSGIADRLRIKNLLKKVVPVSLRDKIPSEDGLMSRSGKADTVDWSHSIALASGQGPVYLLLGKGTEAYDRTRTELREALAALVEPETGQPFFRAVHLAEDVYSGDNMSKGPDLVVEPRHGVHVQGSVGGSEVIAKPSWLADNMRDGLFMACGPSIAGTGQVLSPSILDLAPTVLHLMGQPVPEQMDGRVLAEMFATDSEAARREVAYASETNIEPVADEVEYGKEDEAMVRERLKALGYLGD